MEKQHAYQLTENLLRSPSPLSQQYSNRNSTAELINKRTSSPMTDASTPPPPPLVSPLPSNAVVFQSSRSPQESDASFYNYIDRHFQQGAPALKTHMPPSSSNSSGSSSKNNNSDSNIQPSTSSSGFVDKEKQLMEDEPNTLWAVLKTDLDRLEGNNGSSWTNRNDQLQRQQPWWAWDHSDGIASVGAFLFMFGFIFPPLWWLGAFWPRRPERGGKMATRWQQLNRYFSIGFSIILVIVIIVVAALYGASH